MSGMVTIYLGGRDRITVWRCPNDACLRYRYDRAAAAAAGRQTEGEESDGCASWTTGKAGIASQFDCYDARLIVGS